MHDSADLARSEHATILATPPRTPCPTVVLRHDLPNGDSHFDWMLAVEPRGTEPLVTFQMRQRVDELSTDDGGDGIRVRAIGRHRAVYLTYEGPVSDGRGTVKQVRRGSVEQWTMLGPGQWRLGIAWEASASHAAACQVLRLAADTPDMMHWRVQITDLG